MPSEPSTQDDSLQPPTAIDTSVKLLAGGSMLTKLLTVLMLGFMTIAATWGGLKRVQVELLWLGVLVLPLLSVVPGVLVLVGKRPVGAGTLGSLWLSAACFLGWALLLVPLFEDGVPDLPWVLLMLGLLGGGGMDAMAAIALHEPVDEAS
jgi:hypothetical protein